MTTLESPLRQEWDAWHPAREEQLRTPHGWPSLTALHWLDGTARGYDGIPGAWRAAGDGGVELTADGDPDIGPALDGTLVAGTVRLEPAYATCPLPPAENRLPVAVEAGEHTPPRPDLQA